MRYSELQWRCWPIENMRVSFAVYYTREEVHHGVVHTKPQQREVVRVYKDPSTGLHSIRRCGSSTQQRNIQRILHDNLTEFELLPLLARMEPLS